MRCRTPRPRTRRPTRRAGWVEGRRGGRWVDKPNVAHEGRRPRACTHTQGAHALVGRRADAAPDCLCGSRPASILTPPPGESCWQWVEQGTARRRQRGASAHQAHEPQQMVLLPRADASLAPPSGAGCSTARCCAWPSTSPQGRQGRTWCLCQRSGLVGLSHQFTNMESSSSSARESRRASQGCARRVLRAVAARARREIGGVAPRAGTAGRPAAAPGGHCGLQARPPRTSAAHAALLLEHRGLARQARHLPGLRQAPQRKHGAGSPRPRASAGYGPAAGGYRGCV